MPRLTLTHVSKSGSWLTKHQWGMSLNSHCWVYYSGPLFPKRTDVLPQNLAKFRSREIRLETFQRCRDVCQISERCDHYNIQSRGFETSRDFAVRRLTASWIDVLVPCNVAKPPPLIWRSGTRRLNPRVFNFQISCNNLTWKKIGYQDDSLRNVRQGDMPYYPLRFTNELPS